MSALHFQIHAMALANLNSCLGTKLVMVIYGKYRSLTVTDVNNEISDL